jgi:hypothetical protein
MPKKLEQTQKKEVYKDFVTILGYIVFDEGWTIPSTAKIESAPLITDPGAIIVNLNDTETFTLSRSGLNVNIPSELVETICDSLNEIGMEIVEYQEIALNGPGDDITSYNAIDAVRVQAMVSNSPFLTVRFPKLLTKIKRDETTIKKRGRPKKEASQTNSEPFLVSD